MNKHTILWIVLNLLATLNKTVWFLFFNAQKRKRGMKHFIILILIFTSSASAASVASVKYVNECVETKVSKLADTQNNMQGTYTVGGTITVNSPKTPTLESL